MHVKTETQDSSMCTQHVHVTYMYIKAAAYRSHYQKVLEEREKNKGKHNREDHQSLIQRKKNKGESRNKVLTPY